MALALEYLQMALRNPTPPVWPVRRPQCFYISWAQPHWRYATLAVDSLRSESNPDEHPSTSSREHWMLKKVAVVRICAIGLCVFFYRSNEPQWFVSMSWQFSQLCFPYFVLSSISGTIKYKIACRETTFVRIVHTNFRKTVTIQELIMFVKHLHCI